VSNAQHATGIQVHSDIDERIFPAERIFPETLTKSLRNNQEEV
jgi:hypothetical protein